MNRKFRKHAITAVAMVLVGSSACIEDLTLETCSKDHACKDQMVCRAGRCFHFVPSWEIPPCSSPAAEGRCCDLDPATIRDDDPDCRPQLMTGAALSAPARTAGGGIVAATREGTLLSVIEIGADGQERWSAVVDPASPSATTPTLRVAGDDAVYVALGDRLWTRSAEGATTVLPAGGAIDGGFAVCRGGVAVALVRGPDGRGPVRLDATPEAWALDGPLDRAPALPPVISQPDDAVAVAWDDHTVTLHDLSTGAARGSWPEVPADDEIVSLAADGDGHLWVGTAAGVLERLSIAGDLTDQHGHLRVELGTSVFSPPVLPDGETVVIALDDGRVVQGDVAYSPTPKTLQTLVTTAPGALSLVAGDGLLLHGDCPEGRCLSIFFADAASFFGASFDSNGEHRHIGLPADAAVSLPGPEGLAVLGSGGRLDGLVVAAPTRDAPWPGPDGGVGNGRCAEDAQ